MVDLDGSYLEGGGSIARVALAISTLTQKPFEIRDIRKNRPHPGLKNQHLYCIRALEQLCNAYTEDATLGSTSLKYYPRKISGKTIDIDIQTAGSISLFMQSVLLPSIFAPKPVKINVIGGTDVKWAAPIDYFMQILLPHLMKYADIDCKLIRRGYFPKGNGLLEMIIKPKYDISSFSDFNGLLSHLAKDSQKIDPTEQGHLIQIKGISHASTDLQESEVAERQAKAAEVSVSSLRCPINIQIQYYKTLSTGSGITLWAIFSKQTDEIDINNPIRLGSDSLGERGKKAEEIGKEAAQKLIKEIESKATVDKYLADQMLQFMALIPGSRIKTSEISKHTWTNIYTIEKFLGKKFEIDKENKIITSI